MNSIRSFNSVAILVFLHLPPALAQEGAPIFDNAQYFVGDWPQALATADLNHDGRLDLVTANLSSNDVSVLLSNGVGGFSDAIHYPALAEPRGLAIGDCNEDGTPDVAVACSGVDGFAILHGNGDGSLGPPQGYNAGTACYGIVLADFDRDGHLDAATADSGTDSVSICFGDGGTSFTLPTSYQVGSSPRSLVAGDFDSDGWMDIAAANHAPAVAGVSVLLNLQSGLFGSAVTHYTQGAELRTLQLGDLNGDGILDLAVVRASFGGVVILTGDGQGGFQGPTIYPLSAVPRSIAVEDLNRDGVDDIVGCSAIPPTLQVYWGSSSGSLITGPSILMAGDPLSTVIGDFNQDGILEVATANGNYIDNVSVLLRDPQGNFLPPPRYPVIQDAHGLVAGDWDTDGFPDLATVRFSGNGKLVTLLNDGTGGFLAGTEWPVGLYPTHLATADLDQDGSLDIVVANYHSDTLSIMRGLGNGTFVAGGTLPVGLYPAYVALADLDGNGWLDIVNTNHVSDDVTVFLGTGLGAFALGNNYPAGSQPISVAVGDLNGDGKLDLGVTNNTPTVTVLSGDGVGAFQIAQVVPVSSRPHRLAILDLNQDGRDDMLVTRNVVLGVFSVLDVVHQDMNGTLHAAGSYVAGTAAVYLTLGDLNGDGLSDAVIADSISDRVAVFLSEGQGGFQSVIGYVVGPAQQCTSDPIALAVADYNVDGRPDLATVGVCGGNMLAVLLNRLTDAPGISMCFGDGVGGLCPCDNSGLSGHGCDNSAGSGGALLDAGGQGSLSGDTLLLTSSGELASSLTIFIQGSTYFDHAPFGDGLRCTGGAMKRMYTKFAIGGVASVPEVGESSVSTRSAFLGDPLSVGTIRVYQAYYRDPDLNFCPFPLGNSFNVSNGQQIVWRP